MVEQVGISGAWIGLVGFGVWYYLISIGTPEKEARNILLFLMVLFENVHVFNCRSERKSTFRVALSRNKLLIAAVIVSQGIHLASMYIPVMEDILAVQPISLTLWLQLAALALSVLGVMEIYKWVKFGRR
jgi:magnesium-transporting ATPase (P-type)